MSQEAAKPASPVEPSQSDTNGDAPREATSDQKVESAPVVDADDPDGVLARLTEVEQKKTKDEVASDDEKSSDDGTSKSEEVTEPEPEKPKDKVEADEPDLNSEDGAKEVLATIKNERTRKRMETLLAERKEYAPLADYGAQIISNAAKVGAKKSDMDAWIQLGYGFFAGDKVADEKLVKVLTEQGIIKPPAAHAKVDLDGIRSKVNKLLKVDYAISDDVAQEILSSLDEMEKVAPKVESEPVKQPEKVMEKQPDVKAHAEHQLFLRSQQNVAKKEASYQAKYPTEWAGMRKKAYEKIAEWEKKMPVEEANDVTLWPARLIEAVEAVVSERSKSSSVRPSPHQLRSTQPPASVKKPEKGTEEYEIGLLTGKYSSDDE
jgi:hypothetical protein